MTDQAQAIRTKSLSWTARVLFALAALLSLYFFVVAALPYLTLNSELLGRYGGNSSWILAHIVTGSIALIVGGPQLWMGLTGRTGSLHHKLGWTYLSAIALSSIAAFYLAATNQVHWLFGMELGGLGVAWVITGSLALAAIKKRNFNQHMEWMIRSYVVTLGFVFFRFFVDITSIMQIGSPPERLIGASWICWALPLLITEAVIQGKKIFSGR